MHDSTLHSEPVQSVPIRDGVPATDIPTRQHLDLTALADQLKCVEHKLDTVLLGMDRMQRFVTEVQPLINAGGELAESMANGGPMAMFSQIMGGGRQ